MTAVSILGWFARVVVWKKAGTNKYIYLVPVQKRRKSGAEMIVL